MMEKQKEHSILLNVKKNITKLKIKYKFIL
jgi:hypothetical protein